MSQESIRQVMAESDVFELEMSILQTITLKDLMEKPFEPIQWVVPELLPEGLTLLVGAPKIGKSWLALDLCRTLAFGGDAMNRKHVESGEALYLALEDSERRLQDRFVKISQEKERCSEALHFATCIERADQGGMEALNRWLDGHPGCRLVVIDTLQRFRERSNSGRETYASDYAAMEPLQAMAIQRRLAVVLIHHTRKAEASDPFDKVSGTNALMGASDCTWLLERARGEADGKLIVTGRDVEEQELALRFDPADCRWTVIGNALEVASSREEREILDLLKASDEPLSPKDVQEELGISDSAAKMRLRRMYQAGKIAQVSRGKYTHPEHGHMVTASSAQGVTVEKQKIIPFQSQGHKVTPDAGTD
jgi:hypothetical protein